MYDFKYGNDYALTKMNFIFIESMTISPLLSRQNYLTIDYRDGAIDNSFQNDLNRKIYDNRVITISYILIFNGTENDFQNKYNTMLQYFYNKNETNISLSNCTGTEWKGTLTNLSEGVRLTETTYRFVAQFTVKPFSLGSLITYPKQDFVAGTSIFLFENIGNAYSNKTIIEVTGTFETFSIKNEDKTLSFNGGLAENEKLTLDFENMTIYKNDIKIKNTGWNGSFFELLPGSNSFEVYTNGACSLVIKYYPQYIYSSEVN